MKPIVLHFNKCLSTDGVFIGRPSKWGNPFEIGKHGTREEVIALHREWIFTQPELIAAVKIELKGKNLICFCSPKACHGDTLLEIANDDGMIQF